jgi:hypothetical protein
VPVTSVVQSQQQSISVPPSRGERLAVLTHTRREKVPYSISTRSLSARDFPSALRATTRTRYLPGRSFSVTA